MDLSDMNFQDLRSSIICYGREQLEILTDGFKIRLGHGGSGEVYKGKALDGEMALAVKRLAEGEVYIKMWKTELTLLNKFQHENIIDVVGYCPEYPSLAIMTEFMANGNLRQHIDSDINWILRVQIAYKVAKALCMVHARGVTLYDFKTSNILIDEDYTPKLADFGVALSEEIPDDWKLFDFRTQGYIDPRGPFDRERKVDVFAYGQILYELIAKEKFIGDLFSVRAQFHDRNKRRVFHRQFAEDPSYHKDDGEKLYQLAERCSEVINKRPEIAVVLESFKSLKIGKWLDC